MVFAPWSNTWWIDIGYWFDVSRRKAGNSHWVSTTVSTVPAVVYYRVSEGVSIEFLSFFAADKADGAARYGDIGMSAYSVDFCAEVTKSTPERKTPATAVKFIAEYGYRPERHAGIFQQKSP